MEVSYLSRQCTATSRLGKESLKEQHSKATIFHKVSLLCRPYIISLPLWRPHPTYQRRRPAVFLARLPFRMPEAQRPPCQRFYNRQLETRVLCSEDLPRPIADKAIESAIKVFRSLAVMINLNALIMTRILSSKVFSLSHEYLKTTWAPRLGLQSHSPSNRR